MIRAIIASTIVLGLAGLVAALAHRASASVRHAIWFVGLTTALVVGALAALGPVVEVESTLVNGPGVVPFPADFGQSLSTTAAEVSGAFASAPPAAVVAPRIRADYVLLAIWLAGAAVIVGRAILAHIAVARLIARSEHLDADLRLDVDSSIDVRLSPDVDGPFTIGAFRPVILLPPDAQYWTSERLRIVLVHEAAHVARLDYIAQLVGTLACATYWFNPITWLAVSRLRAEAEHAADDRVLAAGVDGVTYASHLLELARPERAPLSAAMAVGMARGTTRLEKRFTAMLDSGRSRCTVPLRFQAAIGSAALLVAVPFTSLRLIPVSPEPAPITLTAPAPMAVVAPAVLTTTSAKRLSAKAPAVAQTAQQADTVFEQSLNASPGGTLTITLRSGGGVTIHSGEESKVRVRGILSGTQARETQAGMDKFGDNIEFRTIVPERRGNTTNSNHFEFWVPSRFNVSISSGGGAITISGLEGRFTGNTGGGEIRLDNLTGRVDLTTGGGEVRVTNSNLEGSVSTGGGEATVTNTRGGVRVSSGSGPVIRDGVGQTRSYGVGGLAGTTSGSGRNPLIVVDGKIITDGGTSFIKAGGEIHLENVPNGGSFTTGGGEIVVGSVGGPASFTTGGGDVRISNVADDISVTTGAGSVEISVIGGSDAARNITVTSGLGRIVIDLPANLDARFDIESGYTERHGRTKIESAFPLNVTETEEWDSRNGTPRRYVRGSGSIGSGRGLVRIRTMNGDVVIRRK